MIITQPNILPTAGAALPSASATVHVRYTTGGVINYSAAET